MKKKFNTNISKTLKTSTSKALNEAFERRINEASSSWIKSAITWAANSSRNNLDRIPRLEQGLQRALERESKIKVKYPVVILREFTLEITKTSSSGNEYTEKHVFAFVQHYPDEEYYLVYLPADGVKMAAVVVNRFLRTITPVTDAKAAIDLLENFDREKYLSGNNFHHMLNVIQANTRDAEGNIYPADRKIAREIWKHIKETTGINIPMSVFMGTRGAKTKNKARLEDYIYVGGFNIGSALSVRIARFIGCNRPDYNIYPIYLRYGSYAMMMKLTYKLRSVEAFGGRGYGTAYKYFVEAGYLKSTDMAITNISNKSSMLNIYPFLKQLHDLPEMQLELPDGTETNVCDVILSNISRIITEKQMLKQAITISQNDIVNDIITIDLFEKQYNACMNSYKDLQRANKGKVIPYSAVREIDDDDDETTIDDDDETTDEDFGM